MSLHTATSPVVGEGWGEGVQNAERAQSWHDLNVPATFGTASELRPLYIVIAALESREVTW